MEFFETVEARSSCRAYTDRAVGREELERALDAARRAPSAMNSQPWGFHVASGDMRAKIGEIMERTTLYLDEYLKHVVEADRLEAATRFMSRLGGAPIVIALSAPRSSDEMNEVNTLLSVGAAMENLLLGLADQGIGSVNVTFSYWVRDEIADLLGLGADRYITSVIAVGYPDEAPHSTPRRADVVTWHE